MTAKATDGAQGQKAPEWPRVGMVSTYPERFQTHSRKGGVASYTKYLVSDISDGCDVVVFADAAGGTGATTEDGAEIHRCWRAGTYPAQLLSKLLRSDVEVLHIQHEYFLFGGLLSAVLLLPTMIAVRLLRIPTVLTIHGVIPTDQVTDEFFEDLGIRFPSPVLARGFLRVYTSLLCRLANRVVVHEDRFERRLVRQYAVPPRKVRVIPHPLPPVDDAPDPVESRSRLDLPKEAPIIAFFGYLTGYKGVELLIRSLDHLDPSAHLLIAGGEHPRRVGSAAYEEYLRGVVDLAVAVAPDRIHFTGYVDEEEIPCVFGAADICVLPYKYHIASSGPEQLATAYGTPVLTHFPTRTPEAVAAEIESALATADGTRDPHPTAGEIGSMTEELYRDLLS